MVSTNYQKFQKYAIHILGKMTVVSDLVNNIIKEMKTDLSLSLIWKCKIVPFFLKSGCIMSDI